MCDCKYLILAAPSYFEINLSASAICFWQHPGLKRMRHLWGAAKEIMEAK